jgi:hypothetical protein
VRRDNVRDLDAIDRELALLCDVSASIRRLGGAPATALIDELLDERLSIKASVRQFLR